MLNPSPKKAIWWLIVLLFMQFFSAIFYYSLTPTNFYITNEDASSDLCSNCVESLIGISVIEFFLVILLLSFISKFENQSRVETLALYKVPIFTLGRWCFVLLLFVLLQSSFNYWFEFESGDFLENIAGSKDYLLAFVLVILGPVMEELIFRGYLYGAWRRSFLGSWGTLILTSVIFTALHADQYSYVNLTFIFIFSLILGVSREKSGSVVVPIVLHSLSNLVAVVTIVFLGLT